jgi:protein-S-isoprenylcysteine O-methyltransferase Ste14
MHIIAPTTSAQPVAQPGTNAIWRWAGLLLATLAYGTFVIVLAWAFMWLANLGGPTSIDTGTVDSPFTALLINLILLGLFALQHSVMARPGFKRWWTRYVPAGLERSIYVLASSLVLALLFWLWRPLPLTLWEVTQPAAATLVWSIFALGWAIGLCATYLIDHFDMFGLRQAVLFMRQRSYTPPGFQAKGLYALVRHPIMFGFLLAFWATPHMTLGHLVFAAASSAYILVGISLEEADLRREFGRIYQDYAQRVPMLVPGVRRIL